MLKILGVVVVKNGCGQSYDGTLKLTLSEESTNWITDFLYVDADLKQLKADQKLLGGHGQKWVWPVWSWDSKIDKVK